MVQSRLCLWRNSAELSAQIGNVASMTLSGAPVVVVEVLQQFALADDFARMMMRYSRMRYSVGEDRQDTRAPHRLLQGVQLHIEGGEYGMAAPLPRRMSALARAINSPRSKGLAR